MSEVKVNKISPRTNCGTTQLGDAGDTITVTGDLKSNSLKSASGSTITLGQSGDTIQLGCGASQTGFGRTGTVDWDTTAKTASFTAVSGNGYFVNTTSGAITLTLPASPSAGDIVGFNDYARTFSTNNLTVARNGSNIQGSAADGTFSTNGQSTMFVYVDATQGWIPTEDQTTGSYGASYVTATGGTITTCGDFKVHTFTGPGTFCVSCAGNCAGSNTIDYLVVAGGGGGGAGNTTGSCVAGGGGGAGGFRLSNSYSLPAPTTSPLANPTGITVTATGYPITVGGGGPGGPAAVPANGTNGSNSVFSTITSAGGGGGGSRDISPRPGDSGFAGGSGGGAALFDSTFTGGAGNTPPVSPPQGNPGGDTANGGPGGQGGGGGAGAAGSNGSGQLAGPGGVGSFVSPSFAVSCAGTTGPVSGVRYFAGGGAAGVRGCASPSVGRAGGAGGGADSGNWQSAGLNGTTNTGGGASGASSTGGPTGPDHRTGGTGGSGIVIIRYKFQ
jgi:hypothetical protein